jgi:glycosyltransferase involved in cell wall biosynthesis
MNPRASFVIPAFNAQRHISEAIWSCRSQSIKQVEIIVVNDGSTDGTQETIDWHADQDPRVIPVHLKTNVGRSEARNIGNDRVSSDIIMVLDADDLATKSRTKDTLTIFQLKKPDLIYGPFYEIDSLGNVLQKISSPVFNKEFSRTKLFNFIGHSTMAYRKGLSRQIRYQSGEVSDLGIDDWRFQWDAFIKGYKFAVTKAPLAYWRGTGGISSRRDENAVREAKERFLATI